jgi:hypothetical protein
VKKRPRLVKKKPKAEKQKPRKRHLKPKSKNSRPRKIWSVPIFTYPRESNQRFGRQRRNSNLLKLELNTTPRGFTSPFAEARDRVNHPSSTLSVASKTSIRELPLQV